MMIKIANCLRFFRIFLFSVIISLNPISSTIAYSDSSSALGNFVKDLLEGLGNIGGAVSKVFTEGLKCDTLDMNTLIGMLPVSYVTSATMNSKGIMNMLSGKPSKDAICAKNLIIFKASMVAFDVSKAIYDKTDGSSDAVTIVIHYSALIAAISAAVYAVSFIISNYALGREVAENAEICLQNDGLTPMPYNDSQMAYLLGEMNLTNTLENLNNFNDKLCVKYNGQYFWLKDGECTEDAFHTICVQHINGYANILCAICPVGCPCITHIQHGISTVPELKKDANGDIVRDANGNPQFTNDASEYKNRFLLNCRISRVGNGDYQPRINTNGIVDETCANLKGHSKRHFSITGGIVECMTNTARNIFEKPIFADLFSATNTSLYTDINNDYELDLSTILFYQKRIKAIMNGRAFGSLGNLDKANVAQEINLFFTTQTREYCFICANSKGTFNNKTFLQKYSNLSSTNSPCSVVNPGSCIENPVTQIEQEIYSSAYNYTNLISDIYLSSTQQYTAMDILHILSNYNSSSSGDDLQIASEQDLNAVFNSIYASVLSKKNLNDHINALYAQSSVGSKGSILKWSLFDKFNNQIKFISIFILTIWLCILGYRILVGELKLSNNEIVSLAIQVIGFYYIVIADFWKTFLFSFVISISQGVGSAAMEIGDIAGQYTTGSCNYSATRKSAKIMSNIVCPTGYTGVCSNTNSSGDCVAATCNSNTLTPSSVDAQIISGLTCYDGTNIQYSLECSTRDANGTCVSGICVPQNSYIVRPNYEYPYIPVSYYSTTGALSCSSVTANNGSTVGEWVDIPVCCTNSMGNVIDAQKVLSSTLGQYIFYCPDSSYIIDEGYRLRILNAVFNAPEDVISGYNQNDVIPTALKTTNNYGLISDTVVVKTQNKIAINSRVANASDIENFRSKANLNRTYPILKIDYGNGNTVIRDMSYLKFFDQLDCKIMRFLFVGFGSTEGGNKDIDLATMDAGDITGGILSAVKMIFGFFPFGILVFILMVLIALILIVMTIRAVQTYIIGMFGLVMNAYTSPFFFMMSLFPSFASARDTAIKNILSYAIIPPIGFLSLGIYFFILDIAFFGNPLNYPNLFDATGAISSDCYANNISDAPLACIVNKVISKINPDQAYATLIMNIALGMYAGTWGVLGGTLLSSLFGITDTIELFLPFISKLAMGLLLIVGGIAVIDTVEDTVKGLIGMSADTKTGFLDGGVKESTLGLLNVVKSFF